MSRTIWISEMSNNLRRIKAALIDLSGTLFVDNNLTVKSAPESLAKLRNAGITIKFVTNTTKESLNDLHTRLTGLGYQVAKNEIYTSLTAARQLVDELKLKPLLFLDEKAKEDFTGIEDGFKDENMMGVDSVLIGLCPEKFDYKNLNKAFQVLLKNPSNKLIAVHKNRYYKQTQGLHLGCGPFVAALEYALDRKAIVVGKPEREFFMGAAAFEGGTKRFENGEIVMIGDDFRDDIYGACLCGMNGILVKTGKYLEGDENKIEGFQPTCTVRDFTEAVNWILNDGLNF